MDPARDEQLAEEATSWFVRMASDRVGTRDRRAFAAWLARDPAHRRAYREAEALWSALGALPDPRPRTGVAAAAPPARNRAPGGSPWRWGAALAASGLLLAAAGLWGEVGYDRWRADHTTRVGETRAVTLGEGSVVELNTDTALALRMTEDERRIALYRGEAVFTVAHDPDRPFRVVAGHAAATALGTAFALRLSADGVTLGVLEGRVALAPAPGPGHSAAAGDSVTLTAGVEARFAPGGRIETANADIAARTAWRQGRLVFTDRPLGAVVAELDRYRPGVILVLDSAVAEARFTGALGLADTDQALAAIESALPVDVLRLTPWLTILTQDG